MPDPGRGDSLFAVDEDGTPLVLVAADAGDTETIRAFLDAGFPIDSDAGFDLGTTVLICATRGGHRPLTELLLSRGADPDIVERGEIESGTALTWALAELPDPSWFVDALLAAGADPNLARPDGWTPLMLAASFGHEALVRRLLEAGADATIGDPLTAARHRNRDAIAALLEAHGAVDPALALLERSRAEAETWLSSAPTGPTSADPAYVERLRPIVDAIEAWLAEHAPPAAQRLREARGGIDPDLELPFRLPPEFRAYLALFGGHDGLDIAEYDGLSLAAALRRRAGLEKLRAEGTFDTWAPRELGPGNGFVRHIWWHPAWIPFAQDGGGNLYCVDLDPAERGTPGQVIAWEIHGGPAGPVLPSIGAYLQRYLERLHAGEYPFNPETGHLD